ncbi:stress-related protein-like [Gastrolobium bilobum]|uniref:stress-related protein-like n=1 Tax=Gastrolobium bilobum TaxID=150636 RepID=UPI002AAFABD4|nr:stress-related protein-like [Gastrolobium bilobum]
MASQTHLGEENKEEEQQHKLKYLEFVQVATAQVLMRCATVYGCAKERSGPLKPGVRAVEGAVKNAIGPVYDKFHLVPDELLRYADRNLHNSISAAHRAPVAARTTASEMARSVYSKCEPAAKVLYERYEPKAEQCVASAWRMLNRLPLFPAVANVVVPKAAYCTEKYKETVVAAAEKGYRVSAYLPLVPVERIAKVFIEKEKKLE